MMVGGVEACESKKRYRASPGRIENVRMTETGGQHTVIIEMRIMRDGVTRTGSKEVGVIRGKGRRFLAALLCKIQTVVLGKMQNVVCNTFLECWRRLPLQR